jgi:hypothetical protein
VDDKVRYDNEMASYKPAPEGEDSQEAAVPAKKKARTPAAPKPTPAVVQAPAVPATTDDDEDEEEKEGKVKEKKAEKKAKKAKKNKKDKK